MSKFGPIDGKTWTLDNAKHVSLTGWEQAILSNSHSKQRISSIEQDFLHQFWRFSLKKMRFNCCVTLHSAYNGQKGRKYPRKDVNHQPIN